MKYRNFDTNFFLYFNIRWVPWAPGDGCLWLGSLYAWFGDFYYCGPQNRRPTSWPKRTLMGPGGLWSSFEAILILRLSWLRSRGALRRLLARHSGTWMESSGVVVTWSLGHSCYIRSDQVTKAYLKPPRISYPWKPQHVQISRPFGRNMPT
jgi:hypothetical protein